MTVLAAVTGLLLLIGATAGAPAPPARSPVAATGRQPARRRRHRRPAVPDPVATLPEVVDLLAVAAGAGLPVGPAVAAVAPWALEPWGTALSAAVAACAEGALLHDALDALPAAAGDGAVPLVAVLRAGLVDGDSVAGALAGLAADARDHRRRRAQERARRLPVRLLLPLVGCSLPAFVVLTIVPILAGALQGLRLPR